MKNVVPVKLVPSADGPTEAASDASGYHTVYAEYLRGFDDVPVLQDAVRIPARRAQRDFRRGERRDERKEPRLDAYMAREDHHASLALLYAEYCGHATAPAVAARKKTRKSRPRKSKKKR